MIITLKADVSQLEGRVRNAPRRIAFATVNAINATAKLAQRALVLQAGDVFTLRKRQFIERQVAVIKPFASVGKGRAFAEISVGQKPRLLLPQFERGGVRLPFKGKSVAVPVEARPSKTAAVPEALWVSRLRLRRQAAARGGRRGSGRPLWRGEQGTYLVPGAGIFQRLGGAVTKVLYVFARIVRLPPVLRFHATVRGITDRNFARLMREEVAKALAFARGRR